MLYLVLQPNPSTVTTNQPKSPILSQFHQSVPESPYSPSISQQAAQFTPYQLSLSQNELKNISCPQPVCIPRDYIQLPQVVCPPEYIQQAACTKCPTIGDCASNAQTDIGALEVLILLTDSYIEQCEGLLDLYIFYSVCRTSVSHIQTSNDIIIYCMQAQHIKLFYVYSKLDSLNCCGLIYNPSLVCNMYYSSCLT